MQRLRSLDVFRGLTVAAMVIVNNPGDWDTVYWPLLHAEWNGWTPTDLIFPFFLFIVGSAIGLGTRRDSTGLILRRGALIWLLGLFLAAFPFFRLETLRISGVLARIAWCYVPVALFARSISMRAERRRIAVTILVLLLGLYWALLVATPFPGGRTGDLSPEGNIGAWLDRALLGRHTWRGGNWDPEGVLSTIPAIGTTLLGLLSGWFVRDANSPRAIVRGLLAWGLAGLVIGLLASVWLPINKNLWTSSYALFTAGIASACLAVCYWCYDARPAATLSPVSEWLVALGRNALLLFVVSGLLTKTLIYVKAPDGTSLATWIYKSLFVPAAPPHLASLLYALANLIVLSAPLILLHRRRVYWTA